MNIQSQKHSPSRKEREKLRNREAILEAAVHLFAQNGFTETKLEDVAALAEFGKGTLYNYFENKHDLLASALDYAIEKVIRFLDEQLMTVTDPLERIKLIVISQFDYYRTHADFLRVVMGHQRLLGQGHGSVPAVGNGDRFQGLRQLLIDQIQAAMDNGSFKTGDARRYAAYLSGMIHGQVRSLHAGEVDLKDVHPEEILEIFLNGVSHE